MIAANDHQAFRDHESESDVALMRRVRNGDDVAFACLMSRHRKYVNWTLSQLVGNQHDMEDMQQEVFLRVFRARHSYQPQAKFSTWLFTITRNVALNGLRKKSRQYERNLAADDSLRACRLDKMALTAETDLPEFIAERVEVRTVVRCAISDLNRRQRTAIEMAYLQWKSHRAIADSMSTTPEAVKSLLRRTRCKLRDSLHPYTSDGRLPVPAAAD
jgi:RNA polymerase sigma-70 factor (ECF subfamily)